MTGFTRLVIVGTEQRATLVIPSDDAVSTHLGALVKLVREPDPEGDLLTLVHPTGDSIDLTRSLADQDVLDGSILHLVRVRDVPPEPEVSDVSDLVAREFGSSTATKTQGHRVTAATVAAGVLSFFAATTLQVSAPTWAVPVALAVVTAAAIVCALLRWREATRAALAVSIALAVVALLSLTGFTLIEVPSPGLPIAWSFFPLTTLPWLMIASVSALTGIVLGLCERRIAPALGGIVGVILGFIGWLSQLITARPDLASSITGLAALVVLALIPSIALAASGLTKLDDLRNTPAEEGADPEARVVTRARALTSLARANETFQWVVVTVAITIAVSIPNLLLSESGWLVAFGVIIGLLGLLRARVAPLAFSSWSLYLAPLVGAASVPLLMVFGAGATTAWLVTHPAVFTGALIATIALTMLIVTVKPAAHTAARMRRQGDLLESMLAISVVPVILGGFGLYTTLLGVF